ncbi:serine hydrolase [Oceaniferula marina]|uniref:serine hydrolase domain-containing protein n=1 Tax=Oceaniferula marina TaxID=2748318 RepID=UPI0029C9EEA3|nr:serine hydrolase [Oceaniferula marina]
MKPFVSALLLFALSPLHGSPPSEASSGLAPEITDLNAKDVSYAREKEIPYLPHPFITPSPRDLKDGITPGRLGPDGGNKELILQFANQISKKSSDPKIGNTDSFLISYQGKLIFESYFRRGRQNYPHYQMSITKSYTAFALGRAIQLGHLTMEDLNTPVIQFLKQTDPTTMVKGADQITLEQAMTMRSGIRLSQEKIKLLRSTPARLKGQGQIQAYLQHSKPIPPAPRAFKYQASDPAITIQVLDAVVPGSAKAFIQTEFLAKMGITNYHWQDDISGLPKSAAGSSFRSRDMIKFGQLVLNNGKWNGQQFIPADFVELATSPLAQAYGENHYGFFWWVTHPEVNGKKYICKAGRGAGGQFIFMFPELDLVAVITAHNQGMGKMLEDAPLKMIRAFTQ